MTLYTWQHERGALCTMILTDSGDALSEEHFLALEAREGSACLGQDLRQVWIGARLDSNLPTVSRARVWTNSFTMAEHIQQEAIAREGPLHSEELFHLLKTVIQGEALSHAMQFAQRLRDTADEELVTPLETFAAATHREPDLAQLLRAHVNLGHPTIGEFCRALRNGRRRGGQNVDSNVQSAKRQRCRELGGQQLCRNVTVSIKFVASTRWNFGIRWIEKT